MYQFFLPECSFNSSNASLNFSELMVGLERIISRWKKSLRLLTFSLSATLLVYFCFNSITSFFTLSRYLLGDFCAEVRMLSSLSSILDFRSSTLVVIPSVMSSFFCARLSLKSSLRFCFISEYPTSLVYLV